MRPAPLSFQLRTLARYPRSWIRRLTRPDRVRLHGVELELGPETTAVTRRLIYSERYERGEVRCLLANLAPTDVVLEVGAGIGFISTLCALRIGSERVHAFEADPDLLPRIRRTYEINGVRPALYHGLLGVGTGDGAFHVSPEFFTSARAADGLVSTSVSVPRLDVRAAFDRIRPNFVILDIEGGERELVPVMDWSGIDKLAIEVHPHRIGEPAVAALLGFLGERGFREDRWVSSRRKKFLAR